MRSDTPEPGAPDADGGATLWLLAFALAVAVSLFVYRGALQGERISDDTIYLVAHPYTTALTLENLREIVDPFGAAKLFAVNYAPVHLLATAIEVRLFGEATLGYHLVNVVLHAGNAVLFAALLATCGVSRRAALLAGLLFLLHPANVEAVAWISQLKTLAAFAFGFGALLALWRRPLPATLLFAAAMLTKFLAVSLLPMAAALAWTRRAGARTWGWLGAWLGIAALVAVAQLDAFAHGGAYPEPAFADPWVQLRTMAAAGARYLVMAATSWGLSAYHEPPPARAWTDPWFLAALALGVVLTLRLGVTLRRRSPEAAWWVCAAACFAPVSQIVPFYHPIADRYLYFILPGLIGGSLLWGLELRARAGLRSVALDRAALAAVLVAAACFGLRTTSRAVLWQKGDWLLGDAAAHYPHGTKALYIRAVNAAQRGDAAASVAALREAEALRHMSRVYRAELDPRLGPIRNAPEFRAYLRETARDRIESLNARGVSDVFQLRELAAAHALLGEYDEAIALLEQAIRSDERLRPTLLAELESVMALRREARDRAGGR